MLMRFLALLLVLATATRAGAQQNFDTVQVRATHLAGSVHVLFGAGGNIAASVGDDATFIVDDQFAPLTPKIVAAIRTLTPKAVQFVLNTHWHFDRTGGNENMGNAGALIVAHENVRRRMSTEQFIAALNRREPPSPKAALPVVTFTEGVIFHLNGDSIVVTHLAPAHTDGDAMVYFTKANVLHMGDVFNNAGLPFVDLSSGGSIHGIIIAMERAYAMTNDATQIIPGHGAVTDRARLQRWHDMLVSLRTRMQQEIAAGHTVDQVLAAKIVAPWEKEWPAGHERFVRLLFQELSRR